MVSSSLSRQPASRTLLLLSAALHGPMMSIVSISNALVKEVVWVWRVNSYENSVPVRMQCSKRRGISHCCQHHERHRVDQTGWPDTKINNISITYSRGHWIKFIVLYEYMYLAGTQAI